MRSNARASGARLRHSASAMHTLRQLLDAVAEPEQRRDAAVASSYKSIRGERAERIRQ
jgi:hypothetical protein